MFLGGLKLLENHTLHGGTYLYSSYMGIPPPPPGTGNTGKTLHNHISSRLKIGFVENLTDILLNLVEYRVVLANTPGKIAVANYVPLTAKLCPIRLVYTKQTIPVQLPKASVIRMRTSTI